MDDPLASARLARHPWMVRFGTWKLQHRWIYYPVTSVLWWTAAWLIWSPLVTPVFALLGVFALEQLVLLWIRSEGASMAPAIGKTSRGLLWCIPPFRLKRDAIVVVLLPEVRPLTKRLVGLPGDVLIFRDGGAFRREGDEEIELRLSADLTQTEPGASRTVEVPDGMGFVLGDHVTSADSRHFGAVPLSAVAGVYQPWFMNRRLDTPETAPEEEAELAWLREAKPPFLPRLERILEVGGWTPGHLILALRRALLEAGATERVDALLEWAWRERATDGRPLWTLLLATLRAPSDPESALTAVRRQINFGGPNRDNAVLHQWQAGLLARLGRWAEALEAAEDLEARWDLHLAAASKTSALLGLERLDEAEALIARIEAETTWAHPSHAPYYRGLLAARREQDSEAADLLIAALEADFTDPHLLLSSPHLARHRTTPHWHRVSAALTAVQSA